MDDSSLWMLDDLPIGVWVARAPAGKAVYANHAFFEILGMRSVPGSVIEDAPATYRIHDMSGNPYPVEKLPFSRALASGRRVTVDDLVIHRADGRRVPVRAFGRPVRDGKGDITHVIVAFIDITSEAEARAEHATLEARLKVVVDHAPVVCWSADRNGIITLSEGAGLGVLGVRSGDLVGQSVFDLYRDHPTISDYVRQALAGDSFWYTVHVGEASYESWITPVRDAAGEISGVLAVSNDVSEIRKLQARTIQSDRMMTLGTLAASVAHEINNPLTYVLAYLDEVESCLAELGTGPALERARRALEPVKQGVERIATITSDLRTFSRPDDTRLEPIDLRAVVDSVLALMRKEVQARARLSLSLASTRPVHANQARLVQVFMNLLMNAIQALPQRNASENEISIVLRDEHEHVVIEVSDSGPGVRAEDRERIFEPFVTTKPIGVGTGLGLFVCRNVVRGLGGEITVFERPGGGASFRVLLPHGRPRDGSSAVPGEAMPLRGKKVLVIEDDLLVARSMAERLRTEGVHVDLAPGARDGIARLLGSESFDLAYCDLMMNDATGMDVAEELAARAPALLERVVFMTGGAFTPRAAEFVERNADRCIDKPFDIVADLEQRLSRARA